MNSDAIALQAPRDTAFLGHPKGLFFLAFTEAWERFSFYGMTALVVLYMVNQLLLPGRVEHIAGIAGFRAAIESIFGQSHGQRLAQNQCTHRGDCYLNPTVHCVLSSYQCCARLDPATCRIKHRDTAHPSSLVPVDQFVV
jgi:hypothetical protein